MDGNIKYSIINHKVNFSDYSPIKEVNERRMDVAWMGILRRILWVTRSDIISNARIRGTVYVGEISGKVAIGSKIERER